MVDGYIDATAQREVLPTFLTSLCEHSQKILWKISLAKRLIIEHQQKQTFAMSDSPSTITSLSGVIGRGLILYARQWAGASAEDVVQEAFLKLLVESPPPESPKAWLYRVVRNSAIDLKRRERWFRSLPQLDNWFESLPERQAEEHAFDGEMLTKALESLPPEIREIIVSKIWGELNFREIAELIDRPLSSVHLDYQRGIEQLRKFFTKSEPDNVRLR